MSDQNNAQVDGTIQQTNVNDASNPNGVPDQTVQGTGGNTNLQEQQPNNSNRARRANKPNQTASMTTDNQNVEVQTTDVQSPNANQAQPGEVPSAIAGDYKNARTATALVTASQLNRAGNPFENEGTVNPEDGNQPQGRQVLDPHTIEDVQKKFLLRHNLGLANPVYERVPQPTEVRNRTTGETTTVNRTVTQLKEYQFYAVDGKDFKHWVEENFPGYTLDTKTKEVYKTQA